MGQEVGKSGLFAGEHISSDDSKTPPPPPKRNYYQQIFQTTLSTVKKDVFLFCFWGSFKNGSCKSQDSFSYSGTHGR